MLPKIITTQQDLEEICQSFLNNSPEFICIDTEFVRQTTYWPELGLIQMASAKDAVVIDPIPNNLSLSPLLPILRHQGIVKVFHSGRQDMEIFWMKFNELPSPIFDTQIAATFLGLGAGMGYERLVDSLLGISVDKSSQHTDWLKRPLSKEQLKYALNDVLYMRQLYPVLLQQLIEKGRFEWMQDELAILTADETYSIKTEDIWKRVKHQFRGWQELSLLKDLCAWREEQARKQGLNRTSLLEDKIILTLCQSPLLPKSECEDLFKKGRQLVLKRKLFDEFFFVYEKACHLTQDEGEMGHARHLEMKAALKKIYPKTLPEDIKARVSKLKDILNGRANELGIPSHLIAGRSDIESFSTLPLRSHKILSGWRKEIWNGQLEMFFDEKP
ncbi:MAG: ribonuclease D [Alphaproteobacteria bacterium]|nr:ribonuclease D [Alphaproteobacteria bacterium]